MDKLDYMIMYMNAVFMVLCLSFGIASRSAGVIVIGAGNTLVFIYYLRKIVKEKHGK